VLLEIYILIIIFIIKKNMIVFNPIIYCRKKTVIARKFPLTTWVFLGLCIFEFLLMSVGYSIPKIY